jgi:oxygen-dependent protoporphyrinogen oxidase
VLSEIDFIFPPQASNLAPLPPAAIARYHTGLVFELVSRIERSIHGMSVEGNIAIVGGGIAGLAAAYRLTELDPTHRIQLFERTHRAGGVLQTVRDGELLIEQSADNFITNVPWGLELCRRLNLEAELLTTDETRRKAFVVHRGKLVQVPPGFLLMAPSRLMPMLTTPLLSMAGKARLLAERLVPPRRSSTDESLASFARRRFGYETFERLIQPLVGGIYTADPETLSMAATLPRFLELERKYGSVTRGMLAEKSDRSEAQASGARYGLFVAPKGGMAELVKVMLDRLSESAIQYGAEVERVERLNTGKWRITVASRVPDTSRHLAQQEYDAVIVATQAYRTAILLEATSAELAELLGTIPYAGIAIVTLVYRRVDIAHPLDGFGLVVPAVERRNILAASFASNKFPGRAPEDQVLIRVFIGGACQPELADANDERLRAIARTELAELLGIAGEPVRIDIFRWPRSMPQYHVGHVQRVEQIESLAAQFPGLALAGSAYRGVGIPHCIHSGETAAERILQWLSNRPEPAR